VFEFNVEKDKHPITRKISCIKSRCEDSTCTDIDFDDIYKQLNLNCGVFTLYKKLGITV